MREISKITGFPYDVEDCVFFRNIEQSAHYVSWGAKLIDVFVDSKKKFVFVFSKSDHDRLKVRW